MVYYLQRVESDIEKRCLPILGTTMKRIVILEVYNQCLNELIISITCRF